MLKKVLLFSFFLLLILSAYLVSTYFGINLNTKQIFLKSEHSSYDLKKNKNFSEFEKYLQDIGFWKKGAMYDPTTKSPSTAKKLHVILTDTVQTGNNWLAGPVGEEKMLASYEYKMEGDNVFLYLQLDAPVAEASGLNINDVFNTYLLRASYMLVENRGLLFEQHEIVADELVNTKYKEPYIILSTKNKTGFNIFEFLTPSVYAWHSGDCHSWNCGIGTSTRQCDGGPHRGRSCSNNADCRDEIFDPWKCVTVTSCSPAYWEGNQTCDTPKCPGSQCVSNNHCSCGAPTPTPPPPPPPTPTPTPAPPPSCTITLSPDPLGVAIGSSQTMSAATTQSNGIISQVNFTSDNNGAVVTSPDTTVPYTTSVTGVAGGSGTGTVTASAIMGGLSRCSDTATVNVISPGPWWQVVDADITTNGDLISQIPGSSCTLPACNPVFGLKGAGGFPGVPAFRGVTADFLSGAGAGSAAESPYNWLAASRYLGKTYDYAYFDRQIPDDVTINELTPPVTGGTFNSGGAPSRGYVWYHWNGSTLGDLTINGNVNLVGSRRVVLLVEGANVLINGRIQLQRPGQGFFMMVVGKNANGLKGDILVDPSVDNIEGIFLAESEFRTGVASSQLQVRGSVVVYDGVVLQRDLGGANSNTPAEVFTYAPDIIATFPSVFTQRRLRWKEVAP